MEYWNPRYETLSSLSGASRFIISNRLKRLIRDYAVTQWPLDCFALIRRIQDSGKIDLQMITHSGFTDAFDASAEYLPDADCYLIVARPQPEDWKLHSASRRCNFTLAHELGHIFLDHLLVPDELKSPETRLKEDREADEFASRLLMPESLILRGRFSSRADMAAAFLVSEQACFHRLNNLRRLDLLSAPPPACPRCHSRLLSPWARFCRHCGAFLRPGEDPALPVEDGLPEIRLPVPPVCPLCGSNEPAAFGNECPACLRPRDNPCLAEYDQPRHPNLPSALFCEFCGAPTLYASERVR